MCSGRVPLAKRGTSSRLCEVLADSQDGEMDCHDREPLPLREGGEESTGGSASVAHGLKPASINKGAVTSSMSRRKTWKVGVLHGVR